MENPDGRLAAFARRNHSIFTYAHALDAGLTHQQIKHRIEVGIFEHVFLNSYRIAGAPTTWKGKLLAACWAGGFRAVASHRSAAALYGLAGGRYLPEIVCPRWRRARHEGVVVHETKTLDGVDLTVVDNIPATTPECTLLHLAAVCRPTVVEMALDAAEHRELVTLDSVGAMLDRLGKRGRTGAGVLRTLLENNSAKKAPRESEMETMLFQVLRRHGIPEPIPQYVIRHNGRFVAKVDAALPQWRIAIEYDSYERHAGRKALVRDNRRRLHVTAARWYPVAATAPDLRSGGHEVVAAINALRSGAS